MANDGKVVLCVLAGIGVITLLYMVQQQTGEDVIVPEHQTADQVMGLGVQAGMRVNAGTPLDTTGKDHFWHPGFDPDPRAQPTTESKHRYPALPGGNLTTVMHNGWSQMTKGAPAGNDWFSVPPEAAVI
jgi:hypothetical protein